MVPMDVSSLSLVDSFVGQSRSSVGVAAAARRVMGTHDTHVRARGSFAQTSEGDLQRTVVLTLTLQVLAKMQRLVF